MVLRSCLELGEGTWISVISHDGSIVPVWGDGVLCSSDELLVLTGPDGDADVEHLFAGPPS